MLSWLTANLINLVIVAVLVLAVGLAIRSMIRDRKAGKCSCGLLRCMQRRVRRELHCRSLRCEEGAAQVIGKRKSSAYASAVRRKEKNRT